ASIDWMRDDWTSVSRCRTRIPADAASSALRYQSRTGLDLTPLPWYQTLALWKAAIFCEAIYTRWQRGERPNDTVFGPSLEAGVPRLLEMAAQYAGLTTAIRR
ncbi:hypothetical protein ACWCRC_42710, partial [Streptomyces sp. NPDC001940]